MKIDWHGFGTTQGAFKWKSMWELYVIYDPWETYYRIPDHWKHTYINEYIKSNADVVHVGNTSVS